MDWKRKMFNILKQFVKCERVKINTNDILVEANAISADTLFKFINNHIKDLYTHDSGAINIHQSGERLLVDIEWADGVSSFNLFKILELINNKGMITKEEIVDYCLE